MGLVVYLVPLAFAGAVALFGSDYGNGSTRVVGVDPNRGYVWSRRLTFVGGLLRGAGAVRIRRRLAHVSTPNAG
jgi:hypothetical protein